MTLSPVEMVLSAGNAWSAPRRRRVYCCDKEPPVDNGLPRVSGTREESLALSAAYWRDLALAATVEQRVTPRTGPNKSVDYCYSYRNVLSPAVYELIRPSFFQLNTELPATVLRWAEVWWKYVPNDWNRDGETSLADGRVCPRNEQVAAVSRPVWD